MLTISSTTFTFELSSEPCTSVPSPETPGVPVVAVPLEADSVSRLPPWDCSPAGLMKSAICSVPTVVGLAWSGELHAHRAVGTDGDALRARAEW